MQQKDLDKVAELAAWKSEGALGLIKKDNGIQAVYGPKADVLKSDINDILWYQDCESALHETILRYHKWGDFSS